MYLLNCALSVFLAGSFLFPGLGFSAEPDASGNVLDVRLVGQALIRFDLTARSPQSLSEMQSALKGADVSFTNLEVSIHHSDHPPANERTAIRGSFPVVLDNLKLMGFNLLALSNNHSYDLGSTGILGTLDEVRQRDFTYAGTGADLTAATTAGFLTTPAGRVALVSMASGALRENSRAAPGKAGVNELRFDSEQLLLDAEDKERILLEVRKAAQDAPYVIAYHHNHHWGGDRFATPEWLKHWARELIDAGATIYVAHGAPTLHGIEIYHGRPIFYGLGNFIFHTKRVPYYENDKHAWDSIIAQCRFEGDRLIAVHLLPVHLSSGEEFPIQETPILGAPRLAHGSQAADIFERLRIQSSTEGTVFRIDGAEADIVLEPITP